MAYTLEQLQAAYDKFTQAGQPEKAAIIKNALDQQSVPMDQSSEVQSARGADAVYGYGKYGTPETPLSQGSFGQAYDFGQTLISKTRGKVGAGADKGTSAVGAYQMIGSTMENYAKQAFGENWRQVPFTFENQQKVAKLIYEDAQKGNVSAVWPTAKRGDYSNVSFENFSREVLPRESGLSYEENLANSSAPGGSMTRDVALRRAEEAEAAGKTDDAAFYRGLANPEGEPGQAVAAEPKYSLEQLEAAKQNFIKQGKNEKADYLQQVIDRQSAAQAPASVQAEAPVQAEEVAPVESTATETAEPTGPKQYTREQLIDVRSKMIEQGRFDKIPLLDRAISNTPRPDLTEEQLKALPDNPAEFARSMPNPDAEWIQKQYDLKAAMSPLGAAGGFLEGVGKAGADILLGAGRLMGIEPSPQQQAGLARRTEALQSLYPNAMLGGEIAGQIGATLPAGIAASGFRTLGGRMLASGALGAGQAGLTAYGQGASPIESLDTAGLGGLAGAAGEAVFPPLLRGAAKVGRKVFGGAAGKPLVTRGTPSAEFDAALGGRGIDYDSLPADVKTEITSMKDGTSPEQAARYAELKAQGITPTKGQVTEDARQLAKEAELAKTRGPETAPLRQRLSEQKQQLTGQIGEMAAETGGVAGRVGQSIEQSLKTQQANNEIKLGLLYSQAARDATARGGIRIRPTDTKAGIRADVMDDLKITHPAQSKALNDLLVKYGVTPKPRTSNLNVTPLSVSNVRQFSKSLDNIAGDNQALKDAIQPIKNGLSNDLLGVTRNTNVPEGIRKTLTEIGGLEQNMAMSARQPFSVDTDMTRRLLSDETSAGELGSLVKSFRPGTVGSKAAKADLQSSSLMHILEESTTSGKFNPDAFSASLNKIGDEKLNILFGDKAKNLKNMAKMGQSLKLRPGEAPSRAEKRIKDFFMNTILNKVGTTVIGTTLGGSVGGAGGAVLGGLLGDVAKGAIESQLTKRSVAEALKGKPEVLKAAINIDKSFPALAKQLGIAGIAKSQEQYHQKLTIPVRPTMESRTEE